MKYYKLEYDANRPSINQLNVPLNSDYGVAVKVTRDGTALNGDISVGGVAASQEAGGYKLAKLQSGSQCGIAMKTVHVESAPSTNLDVDETYSGTVTSSFMPSNMNIVIGNLSDTPLSGLTVIKSKDVKTWTCSGTAQKEGGDPITLANNLNIVIGSDIYKWSDENNSICKLNQPVEQIELTGTPKIRVSNAFLSEASTTYLVNVNWQIKLDSGDGANLNFTLQTSARDAGYFDIEDDAE